VVPPEGGVRGESPRCGKEVDDEKKKKKIDRKKTVAPEKFGQEGEKKTKFGARWGKILFGDRSTIETVSRGTGI